MLRPPSGRSRSRLAKCLQPALNLVRPHGLRLARLWPTLPQPLAPVLLGPLQVLLATPGRAAVPPHGPAQQAHRVQQVVAVDEVGHGGPSPPVATRGLSPTLPEKTTAAWPGERPRRGSMGNGRNPAG